MGAGVVNTRAGLIMALLAFPANRRFITAWWSYLGVAHEVIDSTIR